ncbi:hypothetical protein [Timonella sp. A28]|uniref:hypothetical protein n=1 Tax=Timonella sp. A28 TaxID=3442640 RepID=UPI003EBFA80F
MQLLDAVESDSIKMACPVLPAGSTQKQLQQEIAHYADTVKTAGGKVAFTVSANPHKAGKGRHVVQMKANEHSLTVDILQRGNRYTIVPTTYGTLTRPQEGIS